MFVYTDILTISSEILVGELISGGASESDGRWGIVSLGRPIADGSLSALSIGLRVNVLTDEARDVALVARDMLQTHLVGGPAYPILGEATPVSEAFSLRHVPTDPNLLVWGRRVEAYRLCSASLEVLPGHLVASILNYGLADLTSCHSEEIVLRGDETGITW
jgi:hypothetical protein